VAQRQNSQRPGDRVSKEVSQKDLFKESIEEKYKAFRLSLGGRQFWNHFVFYAFHRIGNDKKFSSSKAIVEEIREEEIFSKGSEFRRYRVSNNFTAYLAREFMEEYRHRAPKDFFKLNKLKAG